MSDGTASPAPESKGGGLLKWIVGSTLVAFLGAFINNHYNEQNEKARFEHEQQVKQQEFAAQQKQLEAQQNLEREKIRIQHNETALKSLAEHDAQNRNLAEQMAGQYYTVSLENTCKNDLFVVVRYYALDGAIMVKGWYTLKPNQVSRLVSTRDTWFYFYAHDRQGAEVAGELSRTISKARFAYIDDEALPPDWWPLEKPATIKFKRVNFSLPRYGPFIYKLECPASPLLPLSKFPR